MSSTENRDSLSTQCWICPYCFDDHAPAGKCTPRRDAGFMPSFTDCSYIAIEYRRRVVERDALKAQLAATVKSHYDMANELVTVKKERDELKAENARLTAEVETQRGASDWQKLWQEGRYRVTWWKQMWRADSGHRFALGLTLEEAVQRAAQKDWGA